MQLEGEISPSIVYVIDEDLLSIRHDGGRVTMRLKGVVQVDSYTCDLYALVSGWKKWSQLVWCFLMQWLHIKEQIYGGGRFRHRNDACQLSVSVGDDNDELIIVARLR